MSGQLIFFEPIALFAVVALSIVFNIYAYVVYFSHTRQEKIKPNPWSWMIWGVTTLVEAATYHAVSESLLQSFVFYISALLCFVVTVAVWKNGVSRFPSLIEWSSIILTCAALIIWIFFNQEWWAHLVMIISVPISFLPIWVETWEQPAKERSQPWAWWSVSDLLALLIILSLTDNSVKELPYILIEFACHLSMLFIVSGQHGRRIPHIIAFLRNSFFRRSAM